MHRKVVLVTGSSKGIGSELIKVFASNNYNVVITYNNSYELANNLKDYVKDNYYVETLCIKCDITNEKEIINLKQEIINKFGKLDILINNAAFAQDNYIVDKTKDEFMKVLEVNVCGTFLVTKHLSDIVTQTIVNISSTDALDTYNRISMDYCASKAGINSLTKTFAQEFSNLKVIGVMPEWTNTESIKEMNQEYLKSELQRINQDELRDVRVVAQDIFNLINDNEVESGDIFYGCKKNDKKC